MMVAKEVYPSDSTLPGDRRVQKRREVLFVRPSAKPI
jgi:hypothetical protein